MARFIGGGGVDPAQSLPRTFPRMRTRRALRWAFDHFQSDWVFNRLLATRSLRRVAEQIYFHRKAVRPDPGSPGHQRVPSG